MGYLLFAEEDVLVYFADCCHCSYPNADLEVGKGVCGEEKGKKTECYGRYQYPQEGDGEQFGRFLPRGQVDEGGVSDECEDE